MSFYFFVFSSISKCIKGLNVTHETIKILEDNKDSKLFDINHSKFFLDMSPEARKAKAKINNWGLIKVKISAQQMKHFEKLKGNLWNGKRCLQMIYLIKG